MDHNAGVDVVLGTDFMIPAGIRLDLFNATAKLPDEVMIPLIKTLNMIDEAEGSHVTSGPTEVLQIPGREWKEFRLPRRNPPWDTHVLWVRHTETFIPTVTRFKRGTPDRVRLTNITNKLASCPIHLLIVVWVPTGSLPKTEGYVQLDSAKYTEWQLLAYAAVRDKTLFEWEAQLYEEWLANQPPAVERRQYPTPTGVLCHPDDDSKEACDDNEPRVHGGDSHDELCQDGEPVPTSHSDDDDFLAAADDMMIPRRNTADDARNLDALPARGLPEDADASQEQPNDDSNPSPTTHSAPVVTTASTLATLELMFVSAIRVLQSEGMGVSNAGVSDQFEHAAQDIELEDYAHELAFLPDLSEAAVTNLDYTAPNVKNPELSEERQRKLIAVLKQHEKIMIASGNALPPPAYGVVCDIDVQGHAPIKQRARRIALRHLQKLYELLKGLLKADLVAFSDSPWASPVVIVLKKNGIDIRLCIDYKLVNAVTLIMEYAMPLVDDLLTKLEADLWFCSLDAASGFWAVMMTLRARKISAFVCPLGHFEWLRMPFGLKNAPMIYQRMIDNALWGYVQPKGGWGAFAERMAIAEAEKPEPRQLESLPEQLDDVTTTRTKFAAAHDDSATMDPVLQLINHPDADMFTASEPDESSLVPVFDRRSFVDDICFGGRTFED
ncbi:hypothetical protein PF003_g36804 [Phytophthora fragariae]|nr:hypothetical protein PF003_g36804 [Phytophthora fragariae]